MIRWAKLSEPNCLVSSDGRVFSVRRDIRSSHLKCGYVAAPLEHSTYLSKGYKCVRLNRKTFQVHQLVAKAFIGECPEGKQVDHIDRNRLNNDVSNLRYVTPSENSRNRGVVINAKKYSGMFHTHRNGKYCWLPESDRKRIRL